MKEDGYPIENHSFNKNFIKKRDPPFSMYNILMRTMTCMVRGNQYASYNMVINSLG